MELAIATTIRIAMFLVGVAVMIMLKIKRIPSMVAGEMETLHINGNCDNCLAYGANGGSDNSYNNADIVLGVGSSRNGNGGNGGTISPLPTGPILLLALYSVAMAALTILIILELIQVQIMVMGEWRRHP